MIITLSGYPGSGKSTVGKILAKKLGYKRYSIGDLQRRLASENGMRLDEWNALEETDDSHDRKIEDYQKKLGKEEDDFIIDGRLSWYCIPHALKVFLDVDPNEGARRIFEHAKKGSRPDEKKYDSLEEVKEQARERVASENKRYESYYETRWDDKNKFDLVVDTTSIPPEEVVERILEAVKTHT